MKTIRKILAWPFSVAFYVFTLAGIIFLCIYAWVLGKHSKLEIILNHLSKSLEDLK